MNEVFKLVCEYPVAQYKCGIRAGDRVQLQSDIVVRGHDGSPTGEVHRAGEVWTVLSGDLEEPPVVWLKEADGNLCTWSDDADFFKTFAKCGGCG